MTKKDDRRHRFAGTMAAHRNLRTKIAINQVASAQSADRQEIRRIWRAATTPQEAAGPLRTYFEGQSRALWASKLGKVWLTTGYAIIQVMHDYFTGANDFFQSGFGASGNQNEKTVAKQYPTVAVVNATWEQLVGGAISAHSNNVVNITDETYRQIQQVVEDRVNEGASHHEIGQRIEEYLDETWIARGETISRTEVNSAMNTAMLEDAKATVPDLNKVWTCTFINSRQAHMDADGQSVPLDVSFTVDGENLMEPGDPSASPRNLVNCECTMFFEPPQ